MQLFSFNKNILERLQENNDYYFFTWWFPTSFVRYLELQGKLQTDIELIREKKKNVTTEKVRYS